MRCKIKSTIDQPGQDMDQQHNNQNESKPANNSV